MKLTRNLLGVIYESCGGRCYYCSIEVHPFGDWEIDHMTPREQGGSDALWNLVAACRSCNRRKGNRTVDQYRKYLHTRVLNAITNAKEEMWLLPGDGPDGPLFHTSIHLDRAEACMAQARFNFYGEEFDIPRKTDPRFIVTEGGEQ